jgi:hypothetical protein
VHSLLVVHPRLADRFLEIVGTLEETWQRIPVWTADPMSFFDAPKYANRSLHADVPLALRIRKMMRADPVGSTPEVRKRIRGVVGYCASWEAVAGEPTTPTSSLYCRPLRDSHGRLVLCLLSGHCEHTPLAFLECLGR